jgi:D-sedoheptulose 7-phosphate isomerase
VKPATTQNLSLISYVAQLKVLLECAEITKGDGTLFELEPGMSAVMQVLTRASKDLASVYIIGNGGSAGVASHAVVDFVNVAKLRAFTLHEPSLMTCMANDYGYENAFARILAQMAKPGDVLIAISSSGNSKNIRNAVAQMKNAGGVVITFSGFAGDNPLRSLGDINIWLNSKNYGLVEIGHQLVLHNISDRFAIGYEEMKTI